MDYHLQFHLLQKDHFSISNHICYFDGVELSWFLDSWVAFHEDGSLALHLQRSRNRWVARLHQIIHLRARFIKGRVLSWRKWLSVHRQLAKLDWWANALWVKSKDWIPWSLLFHRSYCVINDHPCRFPIRHCGKKMAFHHDTYSACHRLFWLHSSITEQEFLK